MNKKIWESPKAKDLSVKKTEITNKLFGRDCWCQHS